MFLTILSGIVGGLLRLAPEILKFIDAGAMRKHELDMHGAALESQKLTGAQRIEEVSRVGAQRVQEINIQSAVDLQRAQFDAYGATNTAQANTAAAGGAVSAFISALVRPVVTFFVFAMWATYKICVLIYSWQLTGNMVQVMMNNWTQDDWAMLSMIVSFWFVGRSIEKK